MALYHLVYDLDCCLQMTVPLVGNLTPGSCFGSLSCSEICDGYQLLGRLETSSRFQSL